MFALAIATRRTVSSSKPAPQGDRDLAGLDRTWGDPFVRAVSSVRRAASSSRKP